VNSNYYTVDPIEFVKINYSENYSSKMNYNIQKKTNISKNKQSIRRVLPTKWIKNKKTKR